MPNEFYCFFFVQSFFYLPRILSSHTQLFKHTIREKKNKKNKNGILTVIYD